MKSNKDKEAAAKRRLERDLEEEYRGWEYLYEHGGSDPFHSDGVNLNLVRNHIIYDKKQMEELQYFPPIYNRELPPEVPNNYMARKEEIRQNAEKTLEAILADSNYIYLRDNICRMSKDVVSEAHASSVLGYVNNLRCAIDTYDYVTMRRFERTESRLEDFKRCREKIEQLMCKKDKIGQMNIFDFI